MFKYTFLLLLINLFVFEGKSQVSEADIQTLLSKRHGESDRSIVLKITNTKEYKLDSLVEFNYNENSQQWDRPFIKESFTYDHDQETLWIYSSWDAGENVWSELMKEEMSYDQEGNLSGFVTYVIGVDNVWHEFIKEDYRYNTKNKLKQTNRFAWKYSSKQWLETEQVYYSYDDEGKLLKDSVMQWSSDLEEWEKSSKNDYTYIHTGLPHYIYHSVYNKELAEWEQDEYVWYLYSYSFWQLLSKTVYHKHGEEWKRHKMESYIRGERGDINGNNSVVWDYSNEQPGFDYKNSVFEYDYDISSDAILVPYYFRNSESLYYHHKIIDNNLFKKEEGSTEMEQYRKIKYYYSDTNSSTDLNEAENIDFNVYPNPASDFITIECEESVHTYQIEIYNLAGKKILHRNLTSGYERIDVSQLTKGIYFYLIYSNSKRQSGKVLIN
ncbi:T9SS type A sorting domain-containing protein [Carboxylicivirga caseinilyticus]|uniref:T9SS type A sorting domain-containing protein n=1 Tax=Carboxylicivirga caseinilyticus TaxID=3417572 RepID=UPI003D346F44|nr:T9SS type A sorting domain-containing protein [Marinilabiliaceae bacterium A049]